MQTQSHIKPKLLLIADTYAPKIDGTYMFMKEYMKRSSSQFDISLLVPNYGNFSDNESYSFLDLSKYIGIPGLDYKGIALSYSNMKTIIRRIKEADILFIQGPAILSFLTTVLGRFYKKKVVSYLHVLVWEWYEKFLPLRYSNLFERVARRIAMWLYNFNDIVCIPYDSIRLELIRSGLRCRAEVSSLGVDIKRFCPPTDKKARKTELGIAEHSQVIGYCGRVSKEKNVMTLLDGFLKLKNQEDVVLLIVGDGDPDLMHELRSQENCICTGFVTNPEKYLQAMDIFVMPSLTETTSLATLEAMATGLAVVSTKVGFIAEYLERGVNGEFFPKENPRMLSIKLEKLLREPLYAGMLGHNARRKVAYSFSWDRSINKINRILKKVLGE